MKKTITITKTITTELDPCVAPDGCPELEPWMAYVGPYETDAMMGHLWDSEGALYLAGQLIWVRALAQDGDFDYVHCAIDVRTAWAQEHYPEHCRIRNYQEADPFEKFCEAWALDQMQYAGPKWFKGMLKQAYELGQANPTRG